MGESQVSGDPSSPFQSGRRRRLNLDGMERVGKRGFRGFLLEAFWKPGFFSVGRPCKFGVCASRRHRLLGDPPNLPRLEATPNQTCTRSALCGSPATSLPGPGVRCADPDPVRGWKKGRRARDLGDQERAARFHQPTTGLGFGLFEGLVEERG